MEHHIEPVCLFCVSSREDSAAEQLLREHLTLFIQHGRLRVWLAHEIAAGSDREQEIKRRVDESQIVVFLVSARFFASEPCRDLMEYAIQRAEKKKSCVIPVLLCSIAMQGTYFSKLVSLPRNKIPIANWPRPNDAWVDVAVGIDNIALQMQEKGAPSNPIAASVLFSSIEVATLRKIRTRFIPKDVHISYPWLAEELATHYENETIAKWVIHAAETLLKTANPGNVTDPDWMALTTARVPFRVAIQDTWEVAICEAKHIGVRALLSLLMIACGRERINFPRSNEVIEAIMERVV